MAAINPIIPGFSPDPSVVKVDDWYFLVNSSFHMFPGLPLYASQDLVHWKQIGNAINRLGVLDLARSSTSIVPLDNSDECLLATGGLYAPTIRYHNGTFYIVCTNVKRPDEDEDATDQGKGHLSENFIVSCTDIWSNEWSDPVYFEFDGIDPSLFFEGEKAYAHGSAGPGPSTKINLFEIDVKTGEKLSPERSIWRGTGGVWPEGPHIYKMEGWYHLMIAEGGTHENHSVVVSRSRDIWGPYESCPNNPILTAKGTSEYIQYVGHCDAFQDARGDWWGVCLGVRKDAEGRHIMGRETFLTRGRWDGAWLSFDPVQLTPRDVSAPTTTRTLTPIATRPQADFLYIRNPKLESYNVSTSGADVSLVASSIDLSHPSSSPAFIGKRQRSLIGSSATTIQNLGATARDSRLKAGIACYRDEHRLLRVFYDASNSTVGFEIVNKAQQIVREGSHEVTLGDHALTLQIAYTEQQYRLKYAIGQGAGNEFSVMHTVDTIDMTDHDFVGPVIGIFAVATTGKPVVEFTKFHVK